MTTLALSLRVLFFVSASLILYVYAGYPALLLLISTLHRRPTDSHRGVAGHQPVSVIVAVHNEESTIRQRILNVLDQGPQVGEVIVASDGSSDGTVAEARSVNDPRVTVLEFEDWRGRALVHNDCVRIATCNILVFTDASTVFAPNFIEHISAPFLDPTVGMVVGRLAWRTPGSGSSVGLYWGFELFLRRLESDANVLAVGSGPCMAVRRDLMAALGQSDDVDFATPLDVSIRGYYVRHQDGAGATDEAPSTPRMEVRARSRMVVKNLVGTLVRLPTCRNPGVIWAITSHKLLRWLTPFCYMGLAFGALGFLPSLAGWALVTVAALSIALAAVGWLGELGGVRIPLASTASRFAAANIGMGLGVIRAAGGVRVARYERVT